MAELIQLIIVGIWGVVLSTHTRRLLRLAQIKTPAAEPDIDLRRTLLRMWWWLGRPEFWSAMQGDVFLCIQITLMVFLVAWGFV